MRRILRLHWREFLIEAWGLAMFMVSACLLTAWLECPASPLHLALPDASVRLLILGLGMGLTAIAIVYSPWGQRSGAHINPAVTISFLRLGKIDAWDAAFYVLSQFVGGVLGVLLASRLIPDAISESAVRYAVTVPGKHGVPAALLTELAIAFTLMSVVLGLGSQPRWAARVGLATGLCVMVDVVLAGPISGFGMNPARSIGSALVAGEWTAWWIYVLAPPVGMLLATELHVRVRGADAMGCAKLHHDAKRTCIFCNGRLSRTPT